MSSIGSLDRPAASAAGAVRAALIELTRVVDVLQAGSLDGLDDHEVLAVFQDLEAQRRRLPTVDHRLITKLECRGTATTLLARGTAGLLTELLHVDVGAAKSRVRAAGVLGPRTLITGERALNIGRQRADGMSPITGLLDPATRALVDAAFSALARPVPDGDIPDPRSPGQRHHDALAALCPNALASRTLPSNRGLPATVVITMGIDQLEDAAGVATTATGGIVPIRDALAMATDAYPVLCLFDTDGQPLHLGRGARLASPAQRLALHARDRGCTRPGCDMPAQWTQVHHLDEYHYGGLTDVETMCLVCPFDHPLITDHGFTVQRLT